VKLFSYQCSQHSTPDSILEVFGNAKKFQEGKDMRHTLAENKNSKQFVSVVVLDEVGLAEDSPSLPLKALHPLLEDGTSGADAKVQVVTFVIKKHQLMFNCYSFVIKTLNYFNKIFLQLGIANSILFITAYCKRRQGCFCWHIQLGS